MRISKAKIAAINQEMDRCRNKITPGPWSVTYSDGADNGRYVVGPNDDQPQDRLIADCYADSALDLGLPSIVEMRANAKAIAAVPDLVGAANDALDVLEYTLCDCAEDDRARMEPAANALRAALAKACVR